MPCYSSPINSSCTEVTDSLAFYRFGTESGHLDVFRLSLNVEGAESESGKDVMPIARSEHTAVAFPEVHLRPVVFYGGRNASGAAVGDVWLLKAREKWGLKWSLSTSGPARFGHTAVADHGLMVVFGGYDGERYSNQIYAYDVEARNWSTLPSQGQVPQPRTGHTAVVVGDGRMLIHGGHNNVAHFNDTYLYDLKAMQRWVRLNVSCVVNPVMLEATSTVFTYDDHAEWVMFGTPIWSMDLSLTMILKVSLNGYPLEGSWKVLYFSVSPGPLWQMSLVQSTWKGRQVAYMLGGASRIHPKLHKHTEPVSDLWYISTRDQIYQWNFICPLAVSPPPRAGFAATVLNHGEMVFTFGGILQTHTSLITFADASGWGFPLEKDGTLGDWEEYVPTVANLLGVVGTTGVGVPLMYSNYSDNAIEMVLLFGGFLAPSESNPNGQLLSGLLVIAPSLLSWFVLGNVQNKPKPRAFHTGVLYLSRLYVFGGLTDFSVYSSTNELWSWQWTGTIDNTTSYWKRHYFNTSTVEPLPRYGHSAVVTESWKDHGDVMVIFGGTDGSRVFSDMWIYVFRSGLWCKIELTGSSEQASETLPQRFAHSAVIVGRSMFVYGGCGEVPVNSLLSVDSPLPQCPLNGISKETFLFDTNQLRWEELQISNAEGSYFHSSLNLYGGVIYTSGGLGTGNTISSTDRILTLGCSPGYEGSINNGSCTRCPIGSYGLGGKFSCAKCNNPFTTRVAGSTSSASCNVCPKSACYSRGTCAVSHPNVDFECQCNTSATTLVMQWH